MSKKLVIVESPAKSKTIKKFLGEDYTVEACMGHVIDLPKSSLGVDVENDFNPEYIVIPERKKHLTMLKRSLSWTFRICSARSRCPVDETGMNSVIPSITPKMTATIQSGMNHLDAKPAPLARQKCAAIFLPPRRIWFLRRAV